MFFKVNIKGQNADKISYIFGKNPNNFFIKSERIWEHNNIIDCSKDGQVDFTKVELNKLPTDFLKLLIKDGVVNKNLEVINKNNYHDYFIKNGQLVRKKITEMIDSYFFFKKYTDNEIEAVTYSVPDTVSFSKEFNGYVNDKEYTTSSVFQIELFEIFRTALTKEGDFYENEYDVSIEIGPFIPKLSDENLKKLFEPLNFSVDIINHIEEVNFKNKRKQVCFLNLTKHGKIRDIFRQVFVLISAIDNFKHFKPTDKDLEKLKKFTGDWLISHPLSNLISKRYLSYSSYADKLVSEIEEEKKKLNPIEHKVVEDNSWGQDGMNLNTLRMETIKNEILNLKSKKVLDFGCGEGKLLKTLCFLGLTVLGVDSSSNALNKASKMIRILNKEIKATDKVEIYTEPKLKQSSLYYKDSRLKDFDTIVLCEVIEHLELERIPNVIENIMFLEPKNLIISTPNKEFNKFMVNGPKNGLRFYDHRFEFTVNEFNKFCGDIKDKYNYNYKITYVGKTIEDIQPTMMVTFVKEDKNE